MPTATSVQEVLALLAAFPVKMLVFVRTKDGKRHQISQYQIEDNPDGGHDVFVFLAESVTK